MSTAGTLYGRLRARGPLEHLRSDRRERALVAHDAGPQGREAAVAIASCRVLQRHRVALRMQADALFARERRLDRPAGEHGHQCGLPLDAEVLLAAKRAAVRHERDLHRALLDPEDRRDLPAVVKNTLALGEDSDDGAGNRGLGTGEFMPGFNPTPNP